MSFFYNFFRRNNNSPKLAQSLSDHLETHVDAFDEEYERLAPTGTPEHLSARESFVDATLQSVSALGLTSLPDVLESEHETTCEDIGKIITVKTVTRYNKPGSDIG